MENETKLEWIPANSRPKNQIFFCPECGGKVFYIDRNTKEKLSAATSVCNYLYCPWCGKRIKEGGNV